MAALSLSFGIQDFDLHCGVQCLLVAECGTKKKLYLCIYFWLHWVFVAACSLFLVAETEATLLPLCTGFLIAVFFLVAFGAWTPGHLSFSSSGTWAQ